MNAMLEAPQMLDAALVQQALRSAGSRPRMVWIADQMKLTEDALLPLAATHFELEAFDMAMLRTLTPDFNVVSFADCQRRGCVVGYVVAQSELTVVVTDPMDARMRSWLESRLRHQRVHMGLATGADLHAFLVTAEKSVRAMDAVKMHGDNAAVAAQDVSAISISRIDATASPVVRLVDSTLYDALRSGASDIHLETHPAGMVIKYRLDGVLEVIKQIDNIELAHQAISRIKVVSELDIAERRIPQDGRFQVVVDEREIDFRVSIMPNLFGEDAVLRVLDRKHLTGQFQALTLDTLGFDDDILTFIRDASQMPYGLLLVTGPTGSGKTTTLYAALSEINTGLDKIITIEDPIEYQLPGVLQIPVNEKKGLTFVRGLRSILRHDPDKIMVGEIRDAETAHIAVQAALTGHQVFTTVHANNVFDVIGRFANMGVDSYSLVAALNGIVAQRLLRVNCQSCAVVTDAPSDLLRRSGLMFSALEGATFKQGLGCAHCRGTGYRGRRAIAETLPMTDSLRALLVQRAPIADIRQAARNSGFVSLRDAAVALALKGETTLEEINRVTPVE
ncbi:GspE/PulE family protein [Rhodoferax sp.]|uniref:GspE/PulE family protein n=1 Tax=Rhodoferax sp. TaxID=50421 RepID=UPI00284CC173|nr:GspE/PulE family protein [Rhodoferax sp.]MDR3370137.1 GspE/PulE family protein [Rhodoferax sp.]